MNEAAADCEAVRLGRFQGWFTEDSFPSLVAAFQNNPGSWTHLPGRLDCD